jgi:DNA topoisomerase-3
VILQQAVEDEQMRKLLATGRTELLKNFVSARTRRKFSAFLVRGTDGKVGFEFEKREPKAKVAAKPAKAAPAKAEEKPAAKKAPTRKKTAA